MEDTFQDATGDGTTGEVNEDGEYVLIHIAHSDGTWLSLALTADDAFELAETVRTLAAGL